jgi:hypothetical protein
MTVTLHLPPDLDQRLIQEAKRQRLPLDAYTLKLLDTHLPPKDQRLELVTLLDTWIAEVTPKNNKTWVSTSPASLMRTVSLTGSCFLQS